MAKNNPKAQSIRHPSCIDNLIHQLVGDGLITHYVVRDCRHTQRGSPREPLVKFKGDLPTKQVILEAHCGSEGCHKIYVVPNDPQKFKTYISANYS